MSIIEKAIKKLEREKGKDQLVKDSDLTRKSSPLSAASHGVAAISIDYESDAKVDDSHVDVELDSGCSETVTPPSAGVKSDYPVHKIPVDVLAERGMITPQKPRSRIADEYRAIKRPLLQNIENKGAATIENANLIMVTSALPGEGKTFTAINLAMSMATEQDRTVLLVDADVTKASAARVLGIPDDCEGLIDLLEDPEKEFSDILIHTNLPKLRILPAGHLHEHATELLASESMHRLMEELSNRYPNRVIIFDSPPLLMTTESSVLSSFMGQIVYVVAAEQSSQEAVNEAIQHLSEDKAIGVVLNKARQNPLVSHGYGYGYSYGYGYGYGNGERRYQKKSNLDLVQDNG
ncbi:MAG: XrtA-associated tyrosine autokinase [Cellvibrionaceae bacterium]